MASGTIASLRDKGFGFILPDGTPGEADLFFHSTAVTDKTFDQLREGQRVSFEEEQDARDPSRRRAVNVRTSEDGDSDSVRPRES
jgi:CspA family cold shock protein